jgi:chromate transporter
MWKTTAGIFGVFAPLSFATVGGGQAIIADLQRQSVTVHHWLSKGQFADLYAISRMSPGPGSLFATLIGWHVGGLSGAAAATLGIFGPTIILTYGVARLWSRDKELRWQRSLEIGLKPVAAGMILASVYVLFEGMNGGVATRGIALASTILMLLIRINPLALLTMGAGAFAILHVAFGL